MDFVKSVIFWTLKKLSLTDAYRNVRDFIRLNTNRQWLQENSVIFQMPHLVASKHHSAKKMYKYIFFAECVEKYHLRFVPVRMGGGKYRALMDDIWAVLPLKYDFDEYFKNVIKSPERALIRKAIKNGYTVREINYSEHMEEILQINTSKDERGGRPMSSDYTNIHEWDKIVKTVNPYVYMYGCFDPENHLIAYYLFQKHTNFYQTQKGIGHRNHLSMGVMNYLFAYSISELHKKDPDAILQYGLYYDPNSGLGAFKKHAGLQQKRVILCGTNDDYKNLKYFVEKYNIYMDCCLHFVQDYVS